MSAPSRYDPAPLSNLRERLRREALAGSRTALADLMEIERELARAEALEALLGQSLRDSKAAQRTSERRARQDAQAKRLSKAPRRRPRLLDVDPIVAKSWDDCRLSVGPQAVRARGSRGRRVTFVPPNSVLSALHQLSWGGDDGSGLDSCASANGRRSLAKRTRQLLRGLFEVPADTDPLPFCHGRRRWLCLVKLELHGEEDCDEQEARRSAFEVETWEDL